MAFPVIFGEEYSPQALAIFAAMTTKPTSARSRQINALVSALLPIWPKLGVLYVFAAADAQAGLLNWKNPSGTAAVATNSPTFTADRGYSGDGVSAFIDTQIAWNAVPGVTQNDAHLGAYVFAAATAGNLVGLSNSVNVVVDHSAGAFRSRLNTGAITSADTVAASAGESLFVSRSASAQYDRYINGVAGTVAVQTSSALATGTLCALRSNAGFATASPSVRMICAGSSLSAANVAAIHAAVQTYMAAVGAS